MSAPRVLSACSWLLLGSAACEGSSAPSEASELADAARGPVEDAALGGRDVLAIPLDASEPREDEGIREAGVEVELDAEAKPGTDAWLDAATLRDAACVDASAPQLGAALVQHACLHGSDGPFRVVTGGVTPELAPDVSRAHTLYTVMKGPDAARAFLRYEPRTTGDHVMFVARAELLAARQGQSSLLLERGSVDCSALPDSYLVQVLGTEPVDLTLQVDGASAALVIESLASWGDDAWTSTCGAAEPAPASDAGACRSSGPCSSDADCCSYCHDYDHCH